MKDITNFLFERLTINQAREYIVTKRTDEAEAWLSAFWERAKTYKGAKVSRNGYRIYFPYNFKIDLNLGYQQEDYGGLSNKIADKIEMYINSKYSDWDILDIDYLHGKVTYMQDTKMGQKKREVSIGKLIKDDSSLLKMYSSDPIRNIANLEKKKLEIVLSNHAYDIAGMSADRNWTSCMNAITGCNRNWVVEDIKWGTIVCYLIAADDENIQNPLGRILLKPYLNKENVVYYYPEPTIYSSYVGIEEMRDFLVRMCEDIQGQVEMLIKMRRKYGEVTPYPEDYYQDEDKDKFLVYYDSCFADNKLTNGKILDLPIEYNKKTKKWDVYDNIVITRHMVSNGQLKYEFGVCKGDFDCSNLNLTTLKGCPDRVIGNFYCNDNYYLSTLEFGPSYVQGFYNCSTCKLKNLKHIAQNDYIRIECFDNELTSLEGCPKHIISINASQNNITSLKGSPDKVDQVFDVGYNELNSLEGCPKYIGSQLNLYDAFSKPIDVDDFDKNLPSNIKLLVSNVFKLSDEDKKKFDSIIREKSIKLL